MLHIYRMGFALQLQQEFEHKSMAGRCLAVGLALLLNGRQVLRALFSAGVAGKSFRQRLQVFLATFCLLCIIVYAITLFATALLSLYEVSGLANSSHGWVQTTGKGMRMGVVWATAVGALVPGLRDRLQSNMVLMVSMANYLRLGTSRQQVTERLRDLLVHLQKQGRKPA